MDLYRAQKLISALNRTGYDDDIRPDNIDQLFQNWSSSIVLENLTEWLVHDCPSKDDLQRYEKIKSKGYHELPEANDDNSDIMEEIAKQQGLISFYELELNAKKCEIEMLECEAESIESFVEEKSSWNCFKCLQKCIKTVNPIHDESCKSPNVAETFSDIMDIFSDLVSEINEINAFIESYAKPEVIILPGSEFEAIPESQLLIQRMDPHLADGYKAIMRTLGDDYLLNGQNWIDTNRDQLHVRIKTLSCRLLVEGLALLQIFSACLDTFQDHFNQNTMAIQQFIMRIEAVKEKLHVEIPKTTELPEQYLTPNPTFDLLNLIPKGATENLHRIEESIEYNITNGSLVPANIEKLQRAVDELMKSVASQIQSHAPIKLTRAQLDIKDLFNQPQ